MMKNIDFNTIKIHCSSLGKLMTNPQNKSDREAGNLSATAKTHLIEVYAKQLYNFEKQLDNKYIKKGNAVEEEAILELSMILRRPLEKNEEVFYNQHFIGTPDVFYGDICFDVKSSYDWITFLSNVPNELDSTYYAQMQGYLNLLGLKKGYIVYVLLDTPPEELEKQKYYLFNKGNYISEESPEFLRLWAEKEKNLIFSNTPIEERVLFFPVEADPEFIKLAEEKVIKARQFLEDFHKKHRTFNENSIKNIIHELHNA
jgi:hypothetical protein